MLELKIIVASAVIAILAWSGLAAKDHYKTKWQYEIHLEYAEQNRIAINKRNAEIETEKRKNQKSLSDAKEYYEAKLATFDERYRAARADGLRWKQAANSRSATGGIAKAECTCGLDEERKYRLPEHIENGIFDAFKEADRIATKLTALQMIVANLSCVSIGDQK